MPEETSSVPWFDVRLIADGVTAFSEPGHYEEAISYLVAGRERALLVDTGMGVSNLEQMVRQATSLPITVVNTHAHWDHRGENYKFSQIAIHELEAAALEQPVGQEKLRHKTTPGLFTRPTPPGFSPEAWRVPASKATQLLHDHEILQLGGRELEVLHTPGHTPGHICLLDRKQRWLITGDLYYPGTIYLQFDYSDFDQMLVSARTLAALEPDVDWLLPSHNATPMPSSELPKLAGALQRIARGQAAGYEREVAEWGKVRRYEFGTFSVMMRA
jgi:glyoxylase-like metal-dependent hydrolase (beta-lactamase superfamily II)